VAPAAARSAQRRRAAQPGGHRAGAGGMGNDHPGRRRADGDHRGYRDDGAHTAEVMRDGFYHTGDVASRDGDGYITYVGRSDDVFKSSDYRNSPFELDSVLIEHPAVAEAAVVPSPDPVRLSVPKAFIAVGGGYVPSTERARAKNECWEEDFPDLRTAPTRCVPARPVNARVRRRSGTAPGRCSRASRRLHARPRNRQRSGGRRRRRSRPTRVSRRHGSVSRPAPGKETAPCSTRS
jgi:hypothetical protein